MQRKKNIIFLQGWFENQVDVKTSTRDTLCLGLQWKTSMTPMLQSGLFWMFESCLKAGGYICKINNSNYTGSFNMNRTFSGVEGSIQSPSK